MIHKISFLILYFAVCNYGIKTARSLGNRSADRITQRSTARTNFNNRFDDPDIHTNVVFVPPLPTDVDELRTHKSAAIQRVTNCYTVNGSSSYILKHKPISSGLITNKGYPVEEHIVQTDDGYLLSVQRIPHGRNNNREGRDKDVVLLIHGVLGDATNWVLNFPNQSLGFILPDEGYDTWILNDRGCTYSRNHVTYTTNQYRFWNFSFDQVAQYDVPATIDYILDVTGKKDLYVVAHSQGTTSVFAMLSEMPDINDKVKLFIALAPVVFLGHTTTGARVLVPFAYPITAVVNGIASGDFLPNTRTSRIIREKVCGVLPELCESALFALGGKDRMQLNETRLLVYFAHFPSGTSAKSLLHFAQLVRSKKYRKFDYRRRNMKHYNQAVPPDYDLSLITTPTAVFWSTNDKFTNPKDVDILRGKLKSMVFENLVPYPYSHFDFVIALNAAKLIYKPVLQLLAQY